MFRLTKSTLIYMRKSLWVFYKITLLKLASSHYFHTQTWQQIFQVHGFDILRKEFRVNRMEDMTVLTQALFPWQSFGERTEFSTPFIYLIVREKKMEKMTDVLGRARGFMFIYKYEILLEQKTI